MLLGRYEVIRKIGVGGFGEVLLARSIGAEGFERIVAVKRLKGELARKEGSLQGIINEARIGGLLSHPNVVQVLEFIRIGTDYILVMEYVDGIGLQEILEIDRNHPMLSPGLAFDIVIQACEGLHYAHAARAVTGQPLRLIHRDIKPSNLMITRTGTLKIMDFGVARSVTNLEQSSTGSIKGTLRYLSPEQAEGSKEIGHASDLFSLGLVLCEMLIGRPVYEADQDHVVLLHALQGKNSAALEAAIARVPGVGKILRRCLARNPEDRYESAEDFAQALRFLKQDFPSEHGLPALVEKALSHRPNHQPEDEVSTDTTFSLELRHRDLQDGRNAYENLATEMPTERIDRALARHNLEQEVNSPALLDLENTDLRWEWHVNRQADGGGYNAFFDRASPPSSPSIQLRPLNDTSMVPPRVPGALPLPLGARTQPSLAQVGALGASTPAPVPAVESLWNTPSPTDLRPVLASPSEPATVEMRTGPRPHRSADPNAITQRELRIAVPLSPARLGEVTGKPGPARPDERRAPTSAGSVALKLQDEVEDDSSALETEADTADEDWDQAVQTIETIEEGSASSPATHPSRMSAETQGLGDTSAASPEEVLIGTVEDADDEDELAGKAENEEDDEERDDVGVFATRPNREMQARARGAGAQETLSSTDLLPFSPASDDDTLGVELELISPEGTAQGVEATPPTRDGPLKAGESTLILPEVEEPTRSVPTRVITPERASRIVPPPPQFLPVLTTPPRPMGPLSFVVGLGLGMLILGLGFVLGMQYARGQLSDELVRTKLRSEPGLESAKAPGPPPPATTGATHRESADSGKGSTPAEAH